MNKRLFGSLLLILSLAAFSVEAKPKKGARGKETMEKISDVGASSITLTYGGAGDTHRTFRITKNTQIRIDGVKSDPESLQAGMEAHVSPDATDGTLAGTIDAKDAKAHPAKHRVG